MTASLHLPLLSSEEAQTIGVRIHSMLAPSGSIGKKLAEAKKRGKSPAAILQAPATRPTSPRRLGSR